MKSSCGSASRVVCPALGPHGGRHGPCEEISEHEGSDPAVRRQAAQLGEALKDVIEDPILFERAPGGCQVRARSSFQPG